MRSQWYDQKESAIALRQIGMSVREIERKLGIPRSTLSGWFKSVPINDAQIARLRAKKEDGWAKARIKAAETHRANKALRLLKAKQDAAAILDRIDPNDAIQELAFAMLYFGEGAKSNTTSIASSDPRILKFVLAVLANNYATTPDMVRCELHLRADQDIVETKTYWSATLNVPIENFRSTAVDQRSAGKKTYDHYKGVCVIYCGSIAIQRKLTCLYTEFCDRIIASVKNEGD